MSGAPCPVCKQDCHWWELRQRESWHPAPATPAGELKPCGENPAGTHLEFFANAEDLPDLLANGITTTEYGKKVRYHVSLTTTPCYANGDIQIVAKKVSDA